MAISGDSRHCATHPMKKNQNTSTFIVHHTVHEENTTSNHKVSLQDSQTNL